jgi:hypothetical protein
MRLRHRLWAAPLAIAAVLTATTAVAHAQARSTALQPARTTGSCAGSGALFCEDFERQPLGGASSLAWGIETRNATMRVEPGTAPTTHGRRLLHVHTVDNGYAFLRVDNVAQPAGGFFGRMRVRLAQFPTAPDWAHFTLVEATGTGSKEIVRPVGGQYAPTSKGSFWGIGADGGPTGDWTNWRESAPTVADTWQCFEWQLNPADNRVTVWINGVTSPDLTVSTNEHGGAQVPFILPTVTTVKIGWQLYQGGTTPGHFDLWLDDLALSPNRLGC